MLALSFAILLCFIFIFSPSDDAYRATKTANRLPVLF